MNTLKDEIKKFDTLYYNGKVFTGDKTGGKAIFAEGFAVKGEEIRWAGSSAEAADRFEDATKIVDLGGKTVMPGFVDAHMHAIMLAEYSKMIAALPPKVCSIAELIEKIGQAAKDIENAEDIEGEKDSAGNAQKIKWIRGWGYDEGKFSENRPPYRWDLDKGCSHLPVVITRACVHVIAVNSKALEIAGITADTPDPAGGKIGRDENGEPNGILYENAKDLVTCHIPTYTKEETIGNLLALDRLLLSQGVTTISEMGEFASYDFKEIFETAIERGMKTRITAYYFWERLEMDDLCPDGRLPEEMQDRNKQFRVAGIKLIGDGSVSGKTAWVYEPFTNGSKGISVYSDDGIRRAMDFCETNSCQLAFHAMGSAAIDQIVNIASRHKPWNSGPGPYVRVEHAAMPTKEAIAKAAKSGIGFVSQPIFMYCEVESYLDNLGAKRTSECYPLSDWISEGVRFCLSTDAPATAWATPSDPWVSLKAAVSRRAFDGTDVGQRHRLSLDDAIILYTVRGAEMLGLDNVGMIKPGYAADFIVLDRDIFDESHGIHGESSEDILTEVRVMETYIGGKRVYRRQTL